MISTSVTAPISTVSMVRSVPRPWSAILVSVEPSSRFSSNFWLQRAPDLFDLRARLLERHVGFHPRRDPERMRAALARPDPPARTAPTRRFVDTGIRSPSASRRSLRTAAPLSRIVEPIAEALRGKVVSPHAVADHDDAMAGRLFLLGEDAAERRRTRRAS